MMLGEAMARMLFENGPARTMEPLRAALAGELLPEAAFQRSIAQPYLLYSPAPGHRSRTGEVDHNMQGYRGRDVPLDKPKDRIRVLCLGGSTTYGWRVDTAAEAFPAQLQVLLNQRQPAGTAGQEQTFEVINAGLPFGTSAELLTHYHFKFHYFEPDVVVIHTGGNDAMAVHRGHYHPDYSHWRKTMTMPEPWGPVGRRLLQSRLAALVLLPLVSGQARGSQSLERPFNTPPDSRWFPESRNDRPAFRHNVETLVRMVQADGAVALLVPFRLETQHALTAPEADQVNKHAETLEQIASERSARIAPFPASTIPAREWIDDCHLSREGCRLKAAYLVPFVRAAADSLDEDD